MAVEIDYSYFVVDYFVFHMQESFVELLMVLFEDNYYFDYKQESLSEVLYTVLDKLGLDFQIAGSDWNECEGILVGFDMKSGDNKMEDSETLKEYKSRVVDALNEKGLDAQYDEVDIVTGGSDPSGMTFFNDCG